VRVQLDLLAPPARRPPPASPSLITAIGLAEAHGWSGEVRRRVCQGLAITLDGHREGEDARWSQMLPPLRAARISAGHVAGVLRQTGVPHDDRRPAFDAWLGRKLDGVTGGIRHDATACWYQVTVAGAGAAHASGSPVAGSNSSPRRAARISSAR